MEGKKKNDPPPPRAVICPNKEHRYQMYQTDTQWQQPYDQYDLPHEQYLRLIKPFEAAGDPNRMNYKALVALYRKATG